MLGFPCALSGRNTLLLREVVSPPGRAFPTPDLQR